MSGFYAYLTVSHKALHTHWPFLGSLFPMLTTGNLLFFRCTSSIPISETVWTRCHQIFHVTCSFPSFSTCYAKCLLFWRTLQDQVVLSSASHNFFLYSLYFCICSSIVKITAKKLSVIVLYKNVAGTCPELSLDMAQALKNSLSEFTNSSISFSI